LIIKKLFVLFVIASISLNAAHINWNWDYEKALLLAKKQNKNLLVFLRKKECKECQKMLKTTLINQDYIKKINKRYISVIVTHEDQNEYPIELFYTLDFPTLFFVSAEDESFLYDSIFGFVTSIQMKNILSKNNKL
jgi:thioredoxin-related protein